jgi:hypothetical protein
MRPHDHDMHVQATTPGEMVASSSSWAWTQTPCASTT